MPKTRNGISKSTETNLHKICTWLLLGLQVFALEYTTTSRMNSCLEQLSFINVFTKVNQSQMKPVYLTKIYFFMTVHFNIIPHLLVGVQSDLFLSGFSSEAF